MDIRDSIRITNGKYCNRKCESIKGSMCIKYGIVFLNHEKTNSTYELIRCEKCNQDGMA